MTRPGSRALLLPVVLGLLAIGASPARAANPCLEQARELAQSEGGLGGTGLRDEGGIGGTGLFDEGGIGGTGFGDEGGIGGTGIFGTVTGFGSLCVNGLRVELGPDVAIELRGAAAGPDELAVGQVVWIEATGLRAERIRIFSAALGVVEELDASRRRLRIGEQWIELLPRTVLFEAVAGRAMVLPELAPGDFVDVSGLYTPDGRLVASRVERRHPTTPVGIGLPALADLLGEAPELVQLSLESFVAERPADRRLGIDGLVLELAPEASPAQLQPNARVWVQARPAGAGRLRVERIVPLGLPSLPGVPPPSLAPVPDAPRAAPAPEAFDDWSELDLFGAPEPHEPAGPPDRDEPAGPGDPVGRPLPTPVESPSVVPVPIDPAPIDRVDSPSLDVRR